MKKLLLLLVMLNSIEGFSQVAVDMYIDPSMAIRGAYPTDPTPVLNTVTNVKYVWEKVETGVMVEYAGIDYLGISWIGNFIAPITNEIEATIGLDIGGINRWSSGEAVWTNTVGFNGAINLYINKARTFGISIKGNRRMRTDFKTTQDVNIVHSGYVGITYKFK